MADTKSDLGSTVRELSLGLEKGYTDCKALSQVEALQYPELQGLLQTAQRLRPAYTRRLRRISPKLQREKRGVEELLGMGNARFFAVSVTGIISGFKLRLYDKAIEYSQALDAKFEAFYGQMADNMMTNMRERNLAPPTASPNTLKDGHALAGFFAVGVIPKNGNLSALDQLITAYATNYDQVSREANQLLEATKGTVLELKATEIMLPLLFNYGPLGKLGKMRMNIGMMGVLADKKGFYTGIVRKVMPSLVSSRS